MEALPPPEEQEWMLDCLRLLLRRRGAARFLEGPVLRDTDLGPWTPTQEGVASAARRVVERTSLDLVEVEVRHGLHGAVYHPDTPLWLVGVEGAVVRVGVEPSALIDRDTIVGLLAHELAHAWRIRRRLTVEEPDLEERLTDLTAVYLGLGVLLAHRAVRLGKPRSSWVGTPWSISERGALSLDCVAYLLAAQVLARRTSCVGTWSLGRALPREARRPFVRALRHLRSFPGGLAWRLRLPGTEGPARIAPRARPKDPLTWPLHDEQPE